MEDKGFPKYQYSVFVKNGRDGQYVVRSNSLDEFIQQIGQINNLVDDHVPSTGKPARVHIQETIKKLTPEEQEMEDSLVESASGIPLKCEKCGAPATSKDGTTKSGPRAGKPWSGIFCTEVKEHVTWL